METRDIPVEEAQKQMKVNRARVKEEKGKLANLLGKVFGRSRGDSVDKKNERMAQMSDVTKSTIGESSETQKAFQKGVEEGAKES